MEPIKTHGAACEAVDNADIPKTSGMSANMLEVSKVDIATTCTSPSSELSTNKQGDNQESFLFENILINSTTSNNLRLMVFCYLRKNTGHFIDTEFKMQSVLLSCEHFPDQHTSDNIKE